MVHVDKPLLLVHVHVTVFERVGGCVCCTAMYIGEGVLYSHTHLMRASDESFATSVRYSAEIRSAEAKRVSISSY